MSFKKTAEKETTSKKEEVQEQPSKVDVKGLQKELGANFTAFALGDETYRKRMLKDDYSAMKLKYGWLYDQKIE
jgi:hypothetical protein